MWRCIVYALLFTFIQKVECGSNSDVPPIALSINSETQTYGEALILVCKYTVAIESIYWQHNGKLVSLDTSNISWRYAKYEALLLSNSTADEHILRIPDYLDDNAGVYTCVATLRNSTSQVQDSLTVAITPEIFNVNQDDTKTLECSDGHNHGGVLMWFYNGNLLYFNRSFLVPNNFITIGESGNLTLTNITSERAGLYYCTRGEKRMKSFQINMESRGDDVRFITEDQVIQSLTSGTTGVIIGIVLAIVLLLLIGGALFYQQRESNVITEYRILKKSRMLEEETNGTKENPAVIKT